jgi:hypothetical protein
MTLESSSETFSILALDIGSVNTRAILFYEADGQYRFIAQGVSNTTLEAPLSNLSLGIIQAITSLQESTGAVLLDEKSHLILPGQPDGAGVDHLVITYSAGTPLKMVTLGLLRDVSLESANNVACAILGEVSQDICLNDELPITRQLDLILAVQPNLLLVAGGTEEGALQPMQDIIDLVGLVVKLLPGDHIPAIIYAGNSSLAGGIKESLKEIADVQVVPNIRPTLKTENLAPAMHKLAEMTSSIRVKQWAGFSALENICSQPPLPKSFAYGRIVEFLGKSHDPSKGVLGVDLGASSMMFAASNGIHNLLRVFPDGLGNGLEHFLASIEPEEVLKWLPEDAPWGEVQDYLHQKKLFPFAIPASKVTLEYEQAAARAMLQHNMNSFLREWGLENIAFEPIMVSGAILSNSISPWQSLLMVLDGLQPLGVTTIILDQHGVTTSLGAIAGISSLVPVQVLESSAYVTLATVVCPFSEEPFGTKILRAVLEYQDGNFSRFEVAQGNLLQIPLAQGQTANLSFEPLKRVLIDPVIPSLGFKVMGGTCGLVIDARGRPIHVPKDAKTRIPLLNKWLATAG